MAIVGNLKTPLHIFTNLQRGELRGIIPALSQEGFKPPEESYPSVRLVRKQLDDLLVHSEVQVVQSCTGPGERK